MIPNQWQIRRVPICLLSKWFNDLINEEMGGGEGGGMSFHTKYRVIDIEKGNRKIFDLTSKKKIKRPSLDSGIYFCIHLVKKIFHIIIFFQNSQY